MDMQHSEVLQLQSIGALDKQVAQQRWRFAVHDIPLLAAEAEVASSEQPPFRLCLADVEGTAPLQDKLIVVAVLLDILVVFAVATAAAVLVPVPVVDVLVSVIVLDGDETLADLPFRPNDP